MWFALFWTLLGLASAAQRHVLNEIPGQLATVRGLWFMYGNGILCLAGIGMAGVLGRAEYPIRARIVLLLLIVPVVLVVQDFIWLRGLAFMGVDDAPPRPYLWIARYHVKLALVVYSMIAARSLDYLERRRSKEREIAELQEQVSQTQVRAFQAAMEPSEIRGALREVSGAVGRDPDEANRLLAALADRLRARIEPLERGPAVE